MNGSNRRKYDSQSLFTKCAQLASEQGVEVRHLPYSSFDSGRMRGNIENPIGLTEVPTGLVEGLRISGQHARGTYVVPMATTEGALVLTYAVGAKILARCEPIVTESTEHVVHVTPIFDADELQWTQILMLVREEFRMLKTIAEGESSHTHLRGVEPVTVNDYRLLNFSYDTEDAHGLNMINLATYRACQYLKDQSGATFYHRSGFSGVKHPSPYNETQGFGRRVTAKAMVSKAGLRALGVTASELSEFIRHGRACAQAAGIRHVNVHAANAISAIFIACGQDVADLACSHACDFRAHEKAGGRLAVEVEIPNLVVATVGGGTGLPTQKECLQLMGCYGSGKANTFAEVIAAAVLAGEIPTAAAVVNHTYVRAHERYGRN